ncbi:hypothetical protein PIIN_09806 [Serendipita indica DSM 11827]|uniref:Uncharacterized protein n=1 Tax=Serendipita indica (strain DSM 11827) TaxID=1109443 RepID=G4TWX5_SERID|nr:hypothetical protein PIIN_09806 [Serendipita indica DSM 11827]
MHPQDYAILHSTTTTRAKSPISLNAPRVTTTKEKMVCASSETLETALPFRTTLCIVITYGPASLLSSAWVIHSDTLIFMF